MSKFSVLVIIVMLRILYHPTPAASSPVAFGDPSPGQLPARVISISGNIDNNKVYLNWKVSENETADIFEIEKSLDGKNFKMAAMVFGTDKSQTEDYQFYEKAGGQKLIYRIKVVDKNKVAAYSQVVEIIPNV